MTHSIDLKIDKLNEFKVGQGTEYHVSMSAKDLIEANTKAESHLLWKIPLEANVRRPTKNVVTESILKSLKNGSQVISSPIHIAADCLKISTNLIRLTFKDGNDFSDGLLDGGHRLLSLCIAANSKEIDISQVFLNIIIYSGFKGLELKEKAIALNTTKAVSKMSLANYSGDYDWMKQELEKYRIVYYEGQFGLHTTQVDGCCTVSRIAALVLALDTSYKPTAMDERKKHPKYLVGSSNGIRFEIIQKTKKMFSVVHDAISLQSKIFKEIEKRHQSSGTQFTKDAKDARRFTKLPDHEVLSCVITHQLLVLPMISAFRAYVTEENGVLKLQISEKKKAWVIKKMVDRYIEIASQTKRKGQPLSSLAKDDYVWQAMCIISYDLLRID